MVDNVVIDSNVLIKIFKKENDSANAKALLIYLLENRISIIAPQLLIIETIDVCLSQQVATSETLFEFFSNLMGEGIITPQMTKPILKKACELVDYGHPKSGYPSIQDSLYHAYAINTETHFITADERHKKKTEGFGNVILLKDWESALK